MNDLRIAPDLIGKIANKLQKDETPLWASAMGTTVAALRAAATDEDMLQCLLMGLMKPPSRHYRRKMIAYLDGVDDPKVHPLAAHVYARCGIDAVAMTMFADLMTDVIRFVNDTGLEISQSLPFTGETLQFVTIHFRDGILWEHDGIEHTLVIEGGVPDTVANTLTGEPLRRLFDHPVLKGLDVDITGHETEDGGVGFFTANLGSPQVIGRFKI